MPSFSLVGALVNLSVALHILSFWRILKWESESEWEGSAYGLRIDSFKLVWLLVLAYFSTAGIVSVVGAVGRSLPGALVDERKRKRHEVNGGGHAGTHLAAPITTSVWCSFCRLLLVEFSSGVDADGGMGSKTINRE